MSLATRDGLRTYAGQAADYIDTDAALGVLLALDLTSQRHGLVERQWHCLEAMLAALRILARIQRGTPRSRSTARAMT
jgi:hypothetical protein